MNDFLRYAILSISLAFINSTSSAENVILYSENGQGGIQQITAPIVFKDGQYLVNFPKQSYNGSRVIEQIPVHRVRDSAKLLYNQKKWAEKYEYAIEISSGFLGSIPHYFNMESQWIPSPTEDSSDPYSIVPIKKLIVYRSNFNGERVSVKVVLVKSDGQLYLYFGDDIYYATIETNSKPLEFSPSWSREFKYRAQISGFNVFFNI